MGKLIEYAKKMRAYIEKSAQSLNDTDSLEATTLFPKWESGKEYEAGLKLRYNGTLYSVLQAHVSQGSWTPDASPSLFARVLIDDEKVIPEWVQPDSTNPYMTGDKVSHGGKTWVSDVDNNVWEPGVYGWSEKGGEDV